MSLGLLLPLGLLALTALLLPLLLHLERRTESRPTPFAALRWLSMQSRPQRRIRLEELWLLLLRLLLLAVVAMLFARPVLFGGEGGAPRVLVAPGVDIAKARATVRNPQAQWHWLAEGFPAINEARPAQAQPVLSLLREIDASLPAKTAVTVFLPAQLDGLDGERPRLARRIEWRVLEGSVDAPRAKATATAPTLVVRHATDRVASVRYLRAAAVAWHASDAPVAQGTKPASDIASDAQAVPANARWLAWLVPGQLPANIRDWVAGGGIAVLDERVVLPASADSAVVWRDSEGEALARGVAFGRGRIIQLSRPLLPSANPQLLDAQFPTELRTLFVGPPAPPQRASTQALRPLPGGPTFAETPKSLEPWLTLLAAGLFVLERWFASSSRRRRTQ